MAARHLKRKVRALLKAIEKRSGTDAARDEINKLEALCTVDVQEMTDSLMLAFRHYNPIAAKEGKILSVKKKIFNRFSKEVLTGWKAKVSTSKVFELKTQSAGKISFIIPAKVPKGAEAVFSSTNKKICEPLLQKKVYAEHFSLGNQESRTAKGEIATRKKKGNKKTEGSLTDFDAAHGAGFSAFEAEQSLRANAIGAMLDISNLSSASSETHKLASNFVESMLEGESNFTITKGGKVKSTSTLTMSIQTKRQNVQEGGPSGAASKKQKKLLRETEAELVRLIKLNKGKGPDSWGPEGMASPSVIQGVASNIINSPIKKKLYAKRKARNNTKYKKTVRSESTPKQSESFKTETKRISIRGGGITNSMKVAAVRKPKGREKGGGGASDQKDFATKIRKLLKVKRAINARLPAEVRRNMGKPGLTNRTGRFSNSAEVTQILPAAQTLMVKYTYRLNPYETYENTGKKRWPAGYNPKPLIAKSIRGLALGLIDEKLTIRRG